MGAPPTASISLPSEDFQEKGVRLAFDSGHGCLARSGNVQRTRLMGVKPVLDPLRRQPIRRIANQQRPSVIRSTPGRPIGAQVLLPTERGPENQSRLRVSHIPLGALRMWDGWRVGAAVVGRFLQWELRGNRSQLADPSGRTPSSTRQAQRLCRSQRGLIDARLPARNYHRWCGHDTG
jgi:hypothetical protein